MEVILSSYLLNINEDNEILSLLLKNEKVYYSDVITKINNSAINKEKSIILTNVAIYNTKKKESTRRIPYKEILGISYSSSSNEFVIHGNKFQYDYHYNSKDKNLIISLIIFFYDEENSSQMKLCEIPEKTLKNFVTLKKEKQKDCTYTKMDTNYLINTSDFQENNMEYLFFGSDFDNSNNNNNNFNINVNTLNNGENNENNIINDNNNTINYLENDNDTPNKKINSLDLVNISITELISIYQKII